MNIQFSMYFFPNWRFLVRVKNPESGKIRNRHFEAAIIALPGSTLNQNQRIWKETYVFTWIIRGFTYFSPKLTFFYLRFASVKKRQFAGKKVKPLIIHVNKYTCLVSLHHWYVARERNVSDDFCVSTFDPKWRLNLEISSNSYVLLCTANL